MRIADAIRRGAGDQPPQEPVRFHTRSGLLVATRRDRWIELDFPAEPAQAVDAPAGLARALGLASQDMCFVGRNRFDYLVELASEVHVRQLAPDLELLRTIPTRGVIVTSRMDSGGFDLVSRFFAPRVAGLAHVVGHQALGGVCSGAICSGG